MSSFFSWAAAVTAALLLGPLPAALGGTIAVTVGDNFFSPKNVTNSVGDSVQWTWQGNASHSSTGPGSPALWDSGIHSKGFVFTQKFSKAGNFPYRCVVHSFQTGTVVVQAAPTNAPPSVSILSPTNGATFAAPWSGVVSVSAAANGGGTVTKVELFAGSVLLDSVTNPSSTALLNVTNLPAGTYNLNAIAFDNSGATNSSGTVTVQVTTPAPITLQALLRPSATSFQFTYSTTPGLSYVIRRSSTFSDWASLATNTATGTTATFVDPGAGDAFNFYSVQLLPNP